MPDSSDFCSLTGHVALVTGASGGIGSAIALELTGAGAKVAVHYNENEKSARKVADTINEAGGSAVIFRADLSDLTVIPALVAGVAEKLGPPDILISNAGTTSHGFLVRLEQEEIDRLFSINLQSAFHLARECAKHMLKSKWGRLIFISSPAAVAGSPGQSAYAGSKSGLHGFSKSLSLELGRRNITSNVIIPGLVETPMLEGMTDDRRKELMDRIPLHRFAEPVEVAGFVRFVASHEASYLNGQELHFNGGGVVY